MMVPLKRLILVLCLNAIFLRTTSVRASASHNNPYVILGVTKEASQDEIRKNYKKLCLKYHPDKNVQKSEREKKVCEATFKLVQKAYSEIGHEEARRDYEARTSTEWTGGPSQSRYGGGGGGMTDEMFRAMFQQQQRRPRRGVFFNGVDISQFGAGAGLFRPPDLKTVYVQKIRVPLRDLYTGLTNMEVRLKDGVIERYRAVFRGGSGLVLLYQAAAASLVFLGRVRLPFAVLLGAIYFHTRLPRPSNKHYGMTIRRGWKGGTKLRYEDIEPGLDVVFVLEEGRDPNFRRVGNDLVTTVTIDAEEARRGCVVEVEQLGGGVLEEEEEGPIEVVIPPNQTSGDTIRVKGRGWPRTRRAPSGDLIVILKVVKKRRRNRGNRNTNSSSSSSSNRRKRL